jgi:hypothetical protein
LSCMCWQIRSSAKRGGESSDHSTRLALQLPPGHSDHTVAEGLELCIPNAIALERGAIRVPLESVDLDDDPLPGPKEIHFVAAKTSVEDWAG